MKLKSLALLLAITLLAASFPAASLAETFDMDIFRSNSRIFTIDVDSDEEVAFIESTVTNSQLSFTHDYEHPSLYSTARFDILVTNYFNNNPHAVHRMWITYAGTKALNISSVSFIFGGKKYTFSGISDKDWRTTDNEGTVERLLIKFGNSDNLQFLTDLAGNIKEVDGKLSSVDPVLLVLHGSEDVTVELGEGFLYDYLLLTIGVLESNLDYADCIGPTTTEIVDYVP